MVAPGRGFTHSFLFALKFLSGYEHRSTLPQSRIRSAAPSEREPGRAVPFNRVLAKIRRHGRFSSPLRNSKDLTFYHSSNDTPSVTPIRACQLPQRGSRGGLAPFIGVLAKIRGYGRFSSPLRNSKVFTFHHLSGTLPQTESRAATHSRSISTVVTYISLQLAGMSSGVISRRGSPMYFFLCSTPW